MKFNRRTLVLKNDDPHAQPMTLGTLAEEHFNAAAGDDEPISVESAWQYALDEIKLGSYRIVEEPAPSPGSGQSTPNAAPEPMFG